jgi:hypothetical protein
MVWYHVTSFRRDEHALTQKLDDLDLSSNMVAKNKLYYSTLKSYHPSWNCMGIMKPLMKMKQIMKPLIFQRFYS